MISLIKH